MRKNIYKLAAILFTGLVITSCEKEYDSPPIKEVAEGNSITIGSETNPTAISLNGIYQDSVAQGNGVVLYSYKFVDDYSLFATVTMGEQTGNLYKEIYIQDGNSARMKLALTSSSNLLDGDSIRIALKGTTLRINDGSLVLDSVNPFNNIIKVATEKFITPLSVNIADLTLEAHKNRLIRVTNCEFSRSAALSTYATPDAGGATESFLVDCNGNSLLIRTSDYANFAGQEVPDGSGSVVGILGVYGTTLQFYIRDPKEVDMTAASCNGNVIYIKDFEDDLITSRGFYVGDVADGAWQNYWTGDQSVSGQEFSGQYYVSYGAANVKNFDNDNFINYSTTSWLISPKFNLSSTTSPQLSFESATRYNGPPLQLFVSTDYNGNGDPETDGTWTEITSQVPLWATEALTTSDWNYTPCGDIDITAYKSTGTYFAYKYSGPSNQGATWQVDNITIKD
jgi:hypothetical protein